MARQNPAHVDEPAATRPEPLVRVGEPVGLRRYLAWAWRRRDFATELASAELEAEHMDTVLGNLWHLLNPLFLGLVYFLIFGVIFGERGNVENYPAFLLIGILTFYYTRRTMNSGARAVVKNLGLVQSVYFPRVLLPLSGTLTQVGAQAFAVVAMLGLSVATSLVVSGEAVLPNAAWLLLPLIMGVHTIFNFGLACFVARATVHFRDVQQLLPYLTRLWLYLSGVMYTIERVPAGTGRDLFELNPLYVYITLTRQAVLHGTTSGRFWLLGVLWAIPVALLGFLYFRRHEAEYANA